MSLDYPHTCPDIDDCIKNAKAEIKYHLESYLEEDQAKSVTEDIYNDLEPIFERTRKTNEDMRNEANRQIAELNEELEELKDEKKQADLQIDDLQDQVTSLTQDLASS